MLESIEKLLILQDRDRRIRRLRAELARIEPERETFRLKALAAQEELEAAKTRLKQIEADRKSLELEVESKKEQILRYSNQQFQTRKNEEYKALAHEIETCKADIRKIEDQELVLMEQGEAAQKLIAEGGSKSNEARKNLEEQLSLLAQREEKLRKELADLEAHREELVAAVSEDARSRYDRLVRSKGENVVVGIQHGVCGGCHMRVPPQLLVQCQAEKEVVTCSNCGRILYYTQDMDLAIVD
jgi:hypothetical protein